MSSIGRHFDLCRGPIHKYFATLDLDHARRVDAIKSRKVVKSSMRCIGTKMTEQQAETFAKLGGAKWLRALLDSKT